MYNHISLSQSKLVLSFRSSGVDTLNGQVEISQNKFQCTQMVLITIPFPPLTNMVMMENNPPLSCFFNYMLSSPTSTYQVPAYTDVPKCFLCSASQASLLSIALSLNRKRFQSTLIQPPWFDQLVITLVSSLAHIAFLFSITTFQFYQYKGGVYP